MSIKSKTTLSARNKAFWAKPKAEQRVAVAKDVLKQLNDGFYKAHAGTYFIIGKMPKRVIEIPPKLDTLFDHLKTTGAQCDVCGIGSCFTSLVRLGNSVESSAILYEQENKKVKKHDSIEDTPMRELLEKVFSSSQLTLIECAFERSEMHYNQANDTPSFKQNAAVVFGEKYRRDKNRLMAIMQNIIKNKGEFKP